MSLSLYRYLLGPPQPAPNRHSNSNSSSQPATTQMSMSSNSHQSRERRRLQKSPRIHQQMRKDVCPCDDDNVLDYIRAQSCLAIYNDQQEQQEDDCNLTAATTITSHHDHDNQSANSHPHIAFFLNDTQTHHSNSSDESLSMYSASSVISNDNLPITPRLRVRAKTPVTHIGQLERTQKRNSIAQQCDKAMNLAEEYQSTLPPRAFTPYRESEIPRYPSRRLRKMRSQLSLRDLVKNEKDGECRPRTPVRHSTTYSDAETLVGSESPSSLPSPISEKGANRPWTADSGLETKPHVTQQYSEVVSELDHNIALKICADLLTNELASALYRHHPAEAMERASGLQILLMIEAYETVQMQVRKRLWDCRAKGGRDGEEGKEEEERHVRVVDEMIDSWLRVLYEVYDRAKEVGCEEDEAGMKEGQGHVTKGDFVKVKVLPERRRDSIRLVDWRDLVGGEES